MTVSSAHSYREASLVPWPKRSDDVSRFVFCATVLVRKDITTVVAAATAKKQAHVVVRLDSGQLCNGNIAE